MPCKTSNFMQWCDWQCCQPRRVNIGWSMLYTRYFFPAICLGTSRKYWIEQFKIHRRQCLRIFITDYQFITNGTCKNFGCMEVDIQECKRYGKSNKMKFHPGRWKRGGHHGEPSPSHCYLASNSGDTTLLFNQYMTGHNATVQRKKLCICRGLSMCIIIDCLV